MAPLSWISFIWIMPPLDNIFKFWFGQWISFPILNLDPTFRHSSSKFHLSYVARLTCELWHPWIYFSRCNFSFDDKLIHISTMQIFSRICRVVTELRSKLDMRIVAPLSTFSGFSEDVDDHPFLQRWRVQNFRTIGRVVLEIESVTHTHTHIHIYRCHIFFIVR